jgi:hypothetical protein
MLAIFQYQPVRHGEDENGIPLYKNEVFVTITRDITNTVERKMKPEDCKRFPAQWEFFQNQCKGGEGDVEGLMIEMWPPATPADVLNLKGNAIYTLQDLVGREKKTLPTEFAELQDRAKKYLSINGDTAKLLNELAEAKADLEVRNETIKDLQAAVKAAEANAKKASA